MNLKSLSKRQIDEIVKQKLSKGSIYTVNNQHLADLHVMKIEPYFLIPKLISSNIKGKEILQRKTLPRIQDILKVVRENTYVLEIIMFLEILFEYFDTEMNRKFVPIDSVPIKFSPNDNYVYSIYKVILDQKLIFPVLNDTNSRKNSSGTYFIYKWKSIQHVPNQIKISNIKYVKSHLFNYHHENSVLTEAERKIWQKISYFEISELLRERLKSYNYPIMIDTEIEKLLRNGCTVLPLATLYAVVYYVARCVVAKIVEKKLSSADINKEIKDQLNNSLDNIIRNKWQKFVFNRPYNCPQSVFSEVYFSIYLKQHEYWTNIEKYLDK